MPVVRTFISLPAGISRMNLPRFTVLTFVGSYPFSFALITAGYYLGSNWEDLSTLLQADQLPARRHHWAGRRLLFLSPD